MPIQPRYGWLYPIDSCELSVAIRFARAGGRCEGCSRPHERKVVHLGDGRWFDEDVRAWRDERGRVIKGLPRPEQLALPLATTRIALACAHVDQDPTNNWQGTMAA